MATTKKVSLSAARPASRTTKKIRKTTAAKPAPAKKPAGKTPGKKVIVPKPRAKPRAKPLAAIPPAKAIKVIEAIETLKPAKTVKVEKAKKPKLVRDSFTIPKVEYLVLDQLKQRAVQLTRPIKKGELLRAGIKVLAALSDVAFLTALEQVPALKTGRPAAEKKVL